MGAELGSQTGSRSLEGCIKLTCRWQLNILIIHVGLVAKRLRYWVLKNWSLCFKTVQSFMTCRWKEKIQVWVIFQIALLSDPRGEWTPLDNMPNGIPYVIEIEGPMMHWETCWYETCTCDPCLVVKGIYSDILRKTNMFLWTCRGTRAAVGVSIDRMGQARE